MPHPKADFSKKKIASFGALLCAFGCSVSFAFQVQSFKYLNSYPIVQISKFHYIIWSGWWHQRCFSLFFIFQINMLLNFQLGEDCPCPEEIREELYEFHDDLLIHCGRYLSLLTGAGGI